MKKSLFLFLSCAAASMTAQQTCYQNPSVEGPSQAHVVPAPWQACYGSPDTQPGQWGITQAPSNGNAYVSFLHDGMSANGYSEGMTQLLVPAMVANTTYSFTVDLAHSNIYNTASPGNCYSSLQIWGGNTACAQTELLWQSGSFMHTNWQTYTVTFTPTGNWTYIAFEPYFITPCSGYINVMLDNISCIAPASIVSGTQPTCANLCDATATSNVTSGNPPYTYLWAPGGQTTQTVTGLCPGTYTCTVTDASAQTTTGTFTVTAPAPVSVTATSANILCFGQCNGTGTANGTGGTGTITYLWSPGNMTTASVSNLCQGTYTVTATDANGCSVTSTITITEPPQLTSTATSTNVNCFNALTGSASVTPAGGTGTYTYAWNPSGGTQANASNLGAGSYTVTVTDANGCTTTSTVTITQPPQIVPSTTGTPVSCFGTCNGTATLSATGGTGNLSYSWAPSGGNNANASNLCSGNYTVTITDANGCTVTDTAQVNTPPAMVLNTSTLDASCNMANGTAMVTASVGPTPYTYNWAPSGGTNATATGMAAGTYTVTVTDANGCTATTTITVIDNSPVATISPPVIIMAGDNTTLNATGGGTYTWVPNTALSCDTCLSVVANPTVTTTYCVIVTDANGCTASACTQVRVDYPCPTNPDFTVPNAFSPNRDGHNEIFIIQGMGLCMKDFKLIIYDRWGEKVFETTTPNLGWDGTFKGKDMDPGVYMYYITTTLIANGSVIEKKGNVTLIR